MILHKKAAEVADRLKAEVGKAGRVVQAAIVIAAVAFVISVAALLIGVTRRAGIVRAS